MAHSRRLARCPIIDFRASPARSGGEAHWWSGRSALLEATNEVEHVRVEAIFVRGG
jgi:hypothetical protein